MGYSILDLFAGAGGMALGFDAVGARCVGAVEISAPAAKTFATMFAHHAPVIFGGPDAGDVGQLPVEKLLAALPATPDIIVGGPPCQGFSRIGRAKQRSLLNDDERVRLSTRNPERNLLYRYYLDAVAVARPLAFVMENVPGIQEVNGTDLTVRIRREAASLGYNVRCFLLNAAWFGVPQSRWRIFFVGLRQDLGHDAIPEPPLRTHDPRIALPEGMRMSEHSWFLGPNAIPQVQDAAEPITVRDALGDLPRLDGHRDLVEDARDRIHVDQALPYRGTGSAYAQLMRNWPGLPRTEAVTDNWYRHTPRDFPTFEAMAHGDRYPEALMLATRRFNEVLRQLRGAAPAPDTEEFCALRRMHIPPYRNDAFSDKWRKLIPGEVSWTLTAHLSKDTYSHVHYDSRQARTITIREAARLQSFPDGFRFFGNNGDRYKQIGNAVPPILAMALARQVAAQLDRLTGRRAAA